MRRQRRGGETAEVGREKDKDRDRDRVAGSKAGELGPSKAFDSRHGATEFEIRPAGFQSCLGPVFSHYAPTPTLWKGNTLLC